MCVHLGNSKSFETSYFGIDYYSPDDSATAGLEVDGKDSLLFSGTELGAELCEQLAEEFPEPELDELPRIIKDKGPIDELPRIMKDKGPIC